MKELKFSILAVACCLFSEILYAQALPTEPVQIDTVLPVEALAVRNEFGPNLWFTLDDSGSMDSRTPYDPGTQYQIPPDFSGTLLPTPATGRYNLNPFVRYVRGWGVNTVNYGRNGTGVCSSLTGLQRANCSVWATYYRNRLLVMKSSLAISLWTNNNQLTSIKARFGYQSLNSNTAFAKKRQIVPVMPWSKIEAIGGVDTLVTDQGTSKEIFDWLFSLRANSSTPLRARALDIVRTVSAAAQTTSRNNPFTRDPLKQPTGTYQVESGDNPILSCRRNYSILLTDGTWNSTRQGSVRNALNSVGGGYVNDSSKVLPDGKEFKAYHPFTRGTTRPFVSTIADIAFAGWSYDLDQFSGTDTMFGVQNAYPKSDGAGGYSKQVYHNTSPLVPAAESAYWHPYNDPATWQHINTYTIGFGLQSGFTPNVSVNPPRDNTEAATYAGNSNDISTFMGPSDKFWPMDFNGSTTAISTNTVIADLANAAVAGRGRFYDVQSPNDMISAFNDIFNSPPDPKSESDINRGNGGSVSASSTGSDLYYFIAQYNPVTFAGNLLKIRLYNPIDTSFDYLANCWTGPELSKYVNNGVIVALPGTPCNVHTPLGGAQAILRDESDRGLLLTSYVNGVTDITSLDAKVADGSLTPKKTLSKFTFADVGASSVPYLGYSKNLIDYVKGDHSKEVSESSGVYRNRFTKDGSTSKTALGAIGRSNATFIKTPYLPNNHPVFLDSSSALATKFLNFKSTFKSEFSVDGGYVFAGSNDGMMHVFDHNLNEKFAYVPHSFFEKLPLITKPDESFSFIDGEMTVVPIFDLNNEWRYSLTSAMGGGYKGVFSMDMPSPDLGNNLSVWEYSERESRAFNSSSASGGKKDDLSTVGNITSAPAYVLLQDGVWAVVFGNGYNSERNKAALIVMNAITGEVIQELVLENNAVDANSGLKYTDDAVTNGLGPIAQLSFSGKDTSTDKIADLKTDRVYAGDLQGNMWIFDFSQSDSSCSDCIKVASGSGPMLPIVKAVDLNGNPQPITTAPYVTRHITNYGYMLQFGTGSLLSKEDVSVFADGKNSTLATSVITNSIWGIWDDWADTDADKGAGLGRKGEVMTWDRSSDKDLKRIELGLGKTMVDGEEKTIRMLKDDEDPINWKVKMSGNRGWFIDLEARERAWLSPTKEFGNGGIIGLTYITVKFPVDTSSAITKDLACRIDYRGPKSFILTLDEFDATRVIRGNGAIDLNDDSSITSADKVDSFTPENGGGSFSDTETATGIEVGGVFVPGGSLAVSPGEPIDLSGVTPGTPVPAQCLGQSVITTKASASGGGFMQVSSCLTRVPSSWVELK